MASRPPPPDRDGACRRRTSAHRRGPDRTPRDRARERGGGPVGCLARRGRRARPPADARSRGQPECVRRGGGAALRGSPPARSGRDPPHSRLTVDTFDFIVIGAGPAGEAPSPQAPPPQGGAAVAARPRSRGTRPPTGATPSD